ncbi:MAG: AAA family ATPase [Candidatus Edwardsbacteria bacterium]|nr:AAA family ATPase [Candidatus Edwardsbacteria bacterium]
MNVKKKTYSRYLGEETSAKLIEGNLSQNDKEQALRRLAELTRVFSSYLPGGIRRHAQKLHSGAKVEQALLLADVTGFTVLSERLSRIGREGAEEVTGIINSYFAPLIKIVHNYGGDVVYFGGDAFSAGFETVEGEPSPSHLRALQAAYEMQELVKNFTEIKTSAGAFPISLHLALHLGPTEIFSVGRKETDLEYFMAGRVTNYASQLEDLSSGAELLISRELYNKAKGKITAEPAQSDTYKLVKVNEKVGHLAEGGQEEAEDIERSIEHLEAIRPYFSSWLSQRIMADPKSGGVAGEHRRVTMLFLNVWGMDFDDDQHAVSKAQNYFSVLQEVVERYGGIVNKVDFSPQGHKVLILFGAHIAHENDEERALLCALEMLGREEFGYGGVKQRFGVNGGYVYAGTVGSALRREFTVMGDEVNLAARLMSSAGEQELLATAAIQRKNSGKFGFKSLGEKEFKGKKHPITIYQVSKKDESGDDVFAKWMTESKAMVGRQKEKELLNSAVEKGISGQGQIISVVGEAGIGKSRLSRELIQNWAERGYSFFVGNCQSYGAAISYLPWADLLKTYLGIKEADSMEAKTSRIHKMLEIIDPVLKDWSPIIGEVVGVSMPESELTKSLDAKLRQQRLFDLVLDIFSWGAAQEPLLLIIEDLHWADGASLGLLNYVARNIGDKPIVLCMVYRPIEAKHEFAGKEYHSQMTLKELSQEESLELVKTMLNIEGMPPELEQLILKKSQGNPFFVEEVVKSLIEQKVVAEKDGQWQVVTTDIAKINIPDTVQGVIMSRIDRLPIETREVLQISSVIGREFDYHILQAIYPKKIEINPHLNSLRGLDLVLTEQEGNYYFKHIMTQEVAYDSLSFSRRRELHNNIGDHLELSNESKIEEVLELLSHHYFHAQNWEPAFFYSVEAGDKAKKAYANQEALAHYDRALEVFDKMVEAGMLPELTRRIQEELKQKEVESAK